VIAVIARDPVIWLPQAIGILLDFEGFGERLGGMDVDEYSISDHRITRSPDHPILHLLDDCHF
jgi:hypothetical protein